MPKLNIAKSGILNCIIGPRAARGSMPHVHYAPSDRYKMCTVYRNRLCVQELSYIVDLNRLSTQNLLISHGTCKDTRNTQKISIQSKGAGPPACTCTISRGTASNEVTLNTRVLRLNLCKILSICSYTCMVYDMYFSVIFIILLCLALPLAW